MRKNTKAILVFLCALVMVLTGIGMPKAYAAATVDDLTVDYIFDSLGAALEYGTVAREWTQNAHAETNACVDVMNRLTNTIFSNTGSTYFHALGYELQADVTTPENPNGMVFALFKQNKDGTDYTMCPGTEQSMAAGVTAATLTWNIGDKNDASVSELKNTRLFVMQVENGTYVKDGAKNEAELIVTYGPSISASAYNTNYINKMFYPAQKDASTGEYIPPLSEGDSLGIFNTTSYSPGIEFGPETRLYYRRDKYNEETGKTEAEYIEIDPNDKTLDIGAVLVNYYYGDESNPSMAYTKLDGIGFKNGAFVKGDDVITISYSEEKGYASSLVSNAAEYAEELANMNGGEITSLTPNANGGSTVVGPKDENGNVVSLYEAEVGEDGVFRIKDDMGWAGIPVAENEYVIINVVCPSKDGKVFMGTDASDITYFHSEGQTQGEGVQWGGPDSNSSQRVIFNFVYADENGIMRPYEGTVEPTARHGGTLLVPNGKVELIGEVHNGAIIADEVYNGQEIHQRCFAAQARSTWVVMDGGYLTLEKASIGYNWDTNAWEDQSNKEGISLEGAVFGVYSNENCAEDSLVATLETDEKGVATSDLISAGTYWVKEITPLKDHNLSDTVIEVTVVAGAEPTQVVGGGRWEQTGYFGWQGEWIVAEHKFVNQQNNGYTSLLLEKCDEFGNVLQGAEFGVYDADGKLITSAKTNRNGVALFEDVPLRQEPVTYTIKEINPPEGYHKNNSSVEVILKKEEHRDKIVTVDGNGNADGVAFVNEIIRGNFGLKKVDSKTGAVLTGAEFTVYSDKQLTTVVGVLETKRYNYDFWGRTGTASTAELNDGKGLIPGTYYVKETKAPEGYELPYEMKNGQKVDKVYTVEVLAGKMVDLVTGVELTGNWYPETGATGIGNNQLINITGVKTWHDEGFENSRDRLQNIKIQLYRKTSDGEKKVAETSITKEDNSTFKFEQLPRYDENGKEIEYVVKEFMGHGDLPYYSFVKLDKDVQGNITATVANTIKKTKVTGHKVWEDKLEAEKHPERITFLLFAEMEGELIPINYSYGGQMNATGYRHEGYKFTFENLPTYDVNGDPVTYVVKEAESDDYYLVDSDSTSTTENNTTTVDFTLTNRLTVPLKGTKTWVDGSNAGNTRKDIELKIFRMDDKAPGGKQEVHLTGRDAVKGVEIIWNKETDTDVWTWKVVGLPKYSFDKDGKATLNTYTVEEKKVDHYKSETTIDENGDIHFTNTLDGNGRIRLYKMDQDGNWLDGVVFNIYTDESCSEASYYGSATTAQAGVGPGAEHGKLTKEVPYGTYYLKEVTPEGYEPNNKVYTVKVYKPVEDASDIENGDAENPKDPGNMNVVINEKIVTSTTATLPVTKELKTAHYMTRVPEDFSATFEFAIEADEETAKVTGWDILKEKTAVTVNGEGAVTTPDKDAFAIKFTQAGTYTFEVKETTPGTGYIKADDTVCTVTYNVAQTFNGLSVTRTITKGEKPADGVSFVNTYGYVDIVGDKVWKDADNSLRLHIDEGTFKADYLKLYIDGNETAITAAQLEAWGTKFELSYVEDGYWDFKTDETYDTYSWAYENLPAYDEKGEMITYVVKEMTVKGYQTFYVNGGYNAVVDKKDGIYADAVPPSSPSPNVIYNTLSKGTLTINKTVDAQDNAQPETLPEFQFTITPAEGLTGYHFVDAEGKELTSPVTVAVENNADGTISGELTVTILFDNFTEAEKEFAFTVAEVKPDPIPAGWTYDAATYKVTYTVTRDETNHAVSVASPVITKDDKLVEKVDFTNAYKKTFEGSVSFYVNKKLDGKSSTVPFSFELLQRMGDENLKQLAVQENSTISDDPNAALPAGVAAFKLAYDDDDLGETYEYVIRELKKDGYTHDTAEYKYKVVISENGEITRYYWDSEKANYKEGNSHALFSNKTLTSVTVYKYWPNSEPQDVSAYLFLCTLDADGTLTKLDPQPTESKTDNDDSSQTYTWSYLPKFDAAGNEITYAVIEEGLEGYVPEYLEGRNYAKNEETIVNNVIRDNFYIYKQVPDTDEINTASLSFDFTITPGVADGFTLSAHDVDDLEPKLLTPDGEGLYTVSLGAGNQMNFDVVFTKAGTYTFTVEEKFDEVPDGWVYDEHAYIVTFEVGEDGSVKKLEKDDLDCHFTNEYHGTTGLTVCKEWVGAAASDIPVKPKDFGKFLTLRYAAYPLDEDGNIDDDYEFTEDDWTVYEDEYGFEVTVYEDEPNKWYVEYANLPNAIEGKEVTWSVVEDPIDGFTTKYTDDKQWAESWETITNSSVLTSASINKAWLNESFESADKVPNIADKLTLCKLVDGVPVPVENAPTPVYIPDTEKSGMYTWNDLPMFENGKEIEYVVIEQKMDGYEQTYFDRYGCIIENGTYAPHGGGIDNAKVEEEIETTNVSVMKVWVGGPLVDSDISDNLVLFADGVAQTDKPTKTDNVYAWYDLPKYDEDGELITYSIKEDDVADGYTVTYQDENGEDAGDAAFDGGMITNTYEEKTYESEGEVAFDGIKIFDGHTMEGGEFTFILTDKSGKELQRVTNAADGTFAFAPIKYTEKDVPYGTEAEFTYYITELEGKLPGVTYDDAKYEITVGLWDDTDGTIHVGDISDSADGIIFTNTYKAEGSVTFQGAKFLLGREFKAGDEFTFELLNEKGDVIDTVTINPTSGTKADFAFKTIKYDLDDAGKNYTYTYRVKEKAGTEDGMTYDDTVHTVTVTVSDAGDGTLKVVASDAAKHLNFTNTYLAEGAVIFSGTKTMEGKELAGNDFTFVLTDADGKVIETVTNDEDGKIVFSTIEYELEDAGKTFTYKVSEKNDGKKAVTYDDTVYTVTVKVEDAGSGHLKVTASDNATKLNFKNSYEAKAVLTMNAYKTVNGYKPSVDQVYDFVLQGNDGTEMKAQNKAETITFGTIAFDEEDIGKTFIYTVKETTEANELLDVDAAIYQVKVTVADNGDGNLKLETEILKDGKRANGVVFANTATATLAISKNVKGPGPDKAFDLKVTFIGVDGKELEGVYDYDGDVKGTITSGGVIALKDGQSVTIVGLPEGATYTVEENAGPAYTVTVNGKPIAKAEGTLVGHGKLEFINTVEVTTFSVTKVWEGTDLGEITLTLYADGKQITPQPEVTREGNKYTYYNLPKYNEEGEEIVYSAKERGIDGYIRIYNNVEPYQDVTSVVHDGGTIVNRETHEEVHELSFKIHKVWTGVEATEEIPAITLTLYCNGEKLDVPTPKPDSEGWYRYYDLPKSVNGKIAVYTVIEEPIAGYTVTYKTAGGEIVEEGVNGGEIINAKIPQTGDHATLGLWLALMGASAVLLMMLQRRRKA